MIKKQRTPFYKKSVVLVPFMSVLVLLFWIVIPSATQRFDYVADNQLFNGNFQEWQNDMPKGWSIEKSDEAAMFTVKKTEINGLASATITSTAAKDAYVTFLSPEYELSKNILFKAAYKTNQDMTLGIRRVSNTNGARTEVLKTYPNLDYPWSSMNAPILAEASGPFKLRFEIRMYGSGEASFANAFVTTDITLDPVTEGANLFANSLIDLTNDSDASYPIEWQQSQYGNNDAISSYIREKDNRFLRIQATRFDDGFAYWYQSQKTILPATAYTFSLLHKSTARYSIVAAYEMSDGSIQYRTLADTIMPSATWTKEQLRFVTPKDSRSVSVYAEVRSAGTFDFDNYTLTQNTSAPSGTFQRPLVTITFDDGWEASYSQGAATLSEYGYKATYYINPSTIGTKSFMSHDEVKRLLADGNEIASHGNEHHNFSLYSYEAALKDNERAARTLSQRYGIDASTLNFATPYGQYDDRLVAGLQRFYRSHRSTHEGINMKADFNQYNIKTLFIDNQKTDEYIRNQLALAKQENAWLVFNYHQVEDNNDSKFALTKEALRRHLDLIRESGIAVVTTADALKEIEPQF